jgi:hypothetical protein
MEIFRPFAAKFVRTSFDEYSVKHERASTASKPQREKKRIELRHLYPHKHSEDELQQRLETYQHLNQKVLRQRKLIKQNDSRLEENKLKRIQHEVDKFNDTRSNKLRFVQHLREMTDAVPQRRSSQPRFVQTPDVSQALTMTRDNFFSLTQQSRVKSPSSKLRLTDKPVSLPIPTDPKLEPVDNKEGQPIENQAAGKFPKSKLEKLHDRLVSRVRVQSPEYRSMMHEELRKIRKEAELSYELFVGGSKSKPKARFPLYKGRVKSADMDL